MKLLASLSKLKSLFPVIVVGASVAITIKLLTESTPLVSEILKVEAVEDIQKTEYKDELKEPEEDKPEEPPAPEETPPVAPEENKDTEDVNEEKKDESENKSDDGGSEKDNKQKESQKEQKEQKQSNAGKRAFKSDGGTVVDILKLVFGAKKE